MPSWVTVSLVCSFIIFVLSACLFPGPRPPALCQQACLLHTGPTLQSSSNGSPHQPITTRYIYSAPIFSPCWFISPYTVLSTRSLAFLTFGHPACDLSHSLFSLHSCTSQPASLFSPNPRLPAVHSTGSIFHTLPGQILLNILEFITQS